MSAPIPEPKIWADADEIVESRRLWSVLVLAPDLEVARSILLGRPVRACQLDAVGAAARSSQ